MEYSEIQTENSAESFTHILDQVEERIQNMEDKVEELNPLVKENDQLKIKLLDHSGVKLDIDSNRSHKNRQTHQNKTMQYCITNGSKKCKNF